MGQFALHRNLNAASKGKFPYLLDVQADYLNDLLRTRVVIPLCPAASYTPHTIQALTPTVIVERARFVVLTPQLAAVDSKVLGPTVADLSARRTDFIKALDILLSGN